MATTETILACCCGEVTLSVIGNPIINAECLCSDCQKAGAFLQTLAGAPKILDQNQATRFVLYRKDKVKFHSGSNQLKQYSLEKDSPTRRVIASCCNTPIFLEFSNGHWLSIYGLLWRPEELPALDLRTMTRSRPAGVELADNVPNPNTHTFSFYIVLFKAWLAMGFRSPKIDVVSGKINDK
jgi:hypothetical protein